MRKSFSIIVATTTLLAGCSLQKDYLSPVFTTSSQWSGPSAEAGLTSTEQWWTVLRDPAITTLIDGAYVDNPTLAQAVAKMDEAKANVGINRADELPSITATTSYSSAYSKSSGGGGGSSSAVTGQIPGHSQTTTLKPELSWELDLFGRIRSSVTEAQETLNARTADAASTRLSLGIDIANGVLDLRSCNYAAQIDRDTVASYAKTLQATHQKKIAGFASAVDEASAERDLTNADTTLASQNETCAKNLNTLVALTGRDKTVIAELIAQPLPVDAKDATAYFIPQPPQASPELPATVLLKHPSVIAADRDAASAWADIGVAKADQYPQIDLAAALTGQWLRFAGSTISSRGWSLGPTITGTLFDAGKGAANVDAAEARYRQSAAKLQETVRTTVKEVENALAQQQSAQARMQLSQQSVRAAKTALSGAEAQWKSGTINLLELEDKRRQYATVQDNLITAAHDRAQSWTALVSATGNSLTLNKSDSNENKPLPTR